LKGHQLVALPVGGESIEKLPVLLANRRPGDIQWLNLDFEGSSVCSMNWGCSHRQLHRFGSHDIEPVSLPSCSVMASREWGNDVFPSTPGLDAALPRKLGRKHVNLLDDRGRFEQVGSFLCAPARPDLHSSLARRRENVIKDFLLPLGLDTNHGFAKTPVVNSEVNKKREALEKRCANGERWREAAREKAHQTSVLGTKLWKQTKEHAEVLYRALNERLQVLEAQGVTEGTYRAERRKVKAEVDAELEPLKNDPLGKRVGKIEEERRKTTHPGPSLPSLRSRGTFPSFSSLARPAR
jgi:hypothetical protein